MRNLPHWSVIAWRLGPFLCGGQSRVLLMDRGYLNAPTSTQKTSADVGIGVAGAHVLAPVGARKVHGITLGRRDERADFFQALVR